MVSGAAVAKPWRGRPEAGSSTHARTHTHGMHTPHTHCTHAQHTHTQHALGARLRPWRPRTTTGAAANGTDRKGERRESIEQLTAELVDVIRRRGDERTRRARRRKAAAVAGNALDAERTTRPGSIQSMWAKETTMVELLDNKRRWGKAGGRVDDERPATAALGRGALEEEEEREREGVSRREGLQGRWAPLIPPATYPIAVAARGWGARAPAAPVPPRTGSRWEMTRWAGP